MLWNKINAKSVVQLHECTATFTALINCTLSMTSNDALLQAIPPRIKQRWFSSLVLRNFVWHLAVTFQIKYCSFLGSDLWTI